MGERDRAAAHARWALPHPRTAKNRRFRPFGTVAPPLHSSRHPHHSPFHTRPHSHVDHQPLSLHLDRHPSPPGHTDPLRLPPHPDGSPLAQVGRSPYHRARRDAARRLTSFLHVLAPQDVRLPCLPPTPFSPLVPPPVVASERAPRSLPADARGRRTARARVPSESAQTSTPLPKARSTHPICAFTVPAGLAGRAEAPSRRKSDRSRGRW